MERQGDIDHAIATLADAQHGVVSRDQLRTLGLGAGAIEARLRKRRLRPLHRGVYAVGHAELRREGRWLAAVLACAPSAVLSHRTAAALWNLRVSTGGDVEISVPTTAGLKTRDGIRLHRPRELYPDETTVREGIRVTTPGRTLVDLAACLPGHQLRRAVEQAERLELFDLRAVTRALEARRGRPGHPSLAALLGEFREHGVTFTRSDVEAAFLEICRAEGLPRPLVNRHLDGRELDFRWPDAGLVVEVNSYRYHGSRAAFERDHAKRLALEVAGYRVVSVTDWQVMRDPDTVAPSLSPFRSM